MLLAGIQKPAVTCANVTSRYCAFIFVVFLILNFWIRVSLFSVFHVPRFFSVDESAGRVQWPPVDILVCMFTALSSAPGTIKYLGGHIVGNGNTGQALRAMGVFFFLF